MDIYLTLMLVAFGASLAMAVHNQRKWNEAQQYWNKAQMEINTVRRLQFEELHRFLLERLNASDELRRINK